MDFTTSDWITIVIFILGVLGVFLKTIRDFIFMLYKKYRDRKVEVVSPVIDERITSLNKQVKSLPFLDSEGYISKEAILKNHYTLLHNKINTAGKLRNAEVFVRAFNIKGNSEDIGTFMVFENDTEDVKLLDSNKITLTLDDTIKEWNEKVKKVKGYSDREKIQFVSRFHLYFEMIHPFLDGNGRIGRMITSEQLSYLFDKVISFKPEKKKYYEAISLASKGDETPLQLIIQEEVSK